MYILYNEKGDEKYYFWLAKCHNVAFGCIMIGTHNCIYFLLPATSTLQSVLQP